MAKTFEQELQARGVDTSKLSPAEMAKVGRALGIKAPPPHMVEVVEYTPKGSDSSCNYVKTSNFEVGGGKSCRGLFLRVEAIDQAIEDLLAAKAALSK